jgi:DNA-binding GntR family transcriptional regulator
VSALDGVPGAGAAAEDSGLVSRLRAEIVRYLREEDPPVGHRLTERALAERLQVSRSPVRRALVRLHEEGYLERTPSGRYLVARTGAGEGAPPPAAPPQGPDEEDYLRIAGDRLDGELPERVTKSFLQRRYGLTRAQLDQLLLRISSEGWIAPLPGYGWTFLPVLTSERAYRDSYRFRLLVEPAGILEPTFRPDRAALRRRREEQRRLVEGGVAGVSGARLFELNSLFHETVAEASGNAFMVEGLARINRLRRLIEYRRTLVPERAVVRCREHVELADLLLEGRLAEASAFLRAHLSTVGAEKARPLPQARPDGV